MRSGSRFDISKRNNAGINLRLLKLPAAPNIIKVQGSSVFMETSIDPFVLEKRNRAYPVVSQNNTYRNPYRIAYVQLFWELTG